MPYKTEKQRKLMGYALWCKKHPAKECPENIKKVANGMSEYQLKDFARKPKNKKKYVKTFEEFIKDETN